MFYYFLSLHYLHFCVEHINCLFFATQESGAHFIACVPIRDSLEANNLNIFSATTLMLLESPGVCAEG